MKNEHCNGSDFDFLIGKSIIKVEETKVKDEYGCNVDGYILTCSDDTQIIVATNDGCGGCRNGWYGGGFYVTIKDLKKEGMKDE